MQHPIDKVDDKVGCACLRCNSHDEAHNGLRRGTAALKQECLKMEEWFGKENLRTLECYVNGLRSNHMIASFMEIIAWPLRSLYPCILWYARTEIKAYITMKL